MYQSVTDFWYIKTYYERFARAHFIAYIYIFLLHVTKQAVFFDYNFFLFGFFIFVYFFLVRLILFQFFYFYCEKTQIISELFFP